MMLLRPLPRALARPVSWLLVLLWAGQMAWLVRSSYGESAADLTTDLARYSGEAQWKGVYYRGEKLGFSVGQTVTLPDGFENLTLCGATEGRIGRCGAGGDRRYSRGDGRIEGRVACPDHRRRSRFPAGEHLAR